ncbi:hypothetical protein RvY_14070 [Ramazzottius varieornatus]|uniref:2',3'-cyclic-nucleotide 3'-phosphodiesterase n=1 Tax=Ramazzottius varieornatus TaxID=947166 RepID=A0A1D1VV65_RAMVA|nr:hypothetical protein RvY_14070 [Ramazzottius varieornatus]
MAARLNAWDESATSGGPGGGASLAFDSTSDTGFPSLSSRKVDGHLQQHAAVPSAKTEAKPLSYRDVANSMPSPAVRQMSDPKDVAVAKDFPFLSHTLTRQYLKQPGSKLMLVLRGVSGSGKSTLVHQIKTLRNVGIHVEVASADYFFEQNGTYKFDKERLAEAHEFSKREAEKFCADPEAHIVVIDNTNIKYWEFQPYLRMAHRYQLATLLVEPRTAWRYDADELARRTTHGVERDVLVEKVRVLRGSFVFPAYYGWILSARDSGLLRQLAAKYAIAMLQIDDLHQVVDFDHDLLVNNLIRRSIHDLLHLGQGEDLFHLTAFYTAFGKKLGVPEYERSDIVQENLGKCHLLKILGLLITKQTISFRVELSAEQLQLWNQEETSHPTVARGSRAHITVATAKGIAAKVAGHDMLDLHEQELHGRPEHETAISAGRVFRYGPDFWYLELEKSNLIPSLFAPFYTRGGHPDNHGSPAAQTTDYRLEERPELSSDQERVKPVSTESKSEAGQQDQV